MDFRSRCYYSAGDLFLAIDPQLLWLCVNACLYCIAYVLCQNSEFVQPLQGRLCDCQHLLGFFLPCPGVMPDVGVYLQRLHLTLLLQGGGCADFQYETSVFLEDRLLRNFSTAVVLASSSPGSLLAFPVVAPWFLIADGCGYSIRQY